MHNELFCELLLLQRSRIMKNIQCELVQNYFLFCTFSDSIKKIYSGRTNILQTWHLQVMA